mgnify:CR=1 FL=1
MGYPTAEGVGCARRWRAAGDPAKGKAYYYNKDTKGSVWDKPRGFGYAEAGNKREGGCGSCTWEDLIGFLHFHEHKEYRKHGVNEWKFRTFGYLVVEADDLRGRLTQTDFGKSSLFADLLKETVGSSGGIKKGSLDPQDPTRALKDRHWLKAECKVVQDIVDDPKRPLLRKCLGLKQNLGQHTRLSFGVGNDENPHPRQLRRRRPGRAISSIPGYRPRRRLVDCWGSPPIPRLNPKQARCDYSV